VHDRYIYTLEAWECTKIKCNKNIIITVLDKPD